MKDISINQLANNDLTRFKQQLLEGIKAGKPLSGKDGLLTPLLKEVIEASLEGELDAHLAKEQKNNKNNRRNGYNSKDMRSESGTFSLATPRDRNSTFEPQIVKKRQTVVNDTMDRKMLSLTKSAFSSETALFKLMYCACQKIQKKWSAPMHNWGLIISQLDLHFEGRVNLTEKINI